MGKMQGLSQGQRSLNRSTRELLERLAGKERLSMTDEQRLAQLAAQQEMIRQGLQEVTENLDEAEDLLGDMNELGKDMEQVGKDLGDHRVDPRILERQQQILSRLLDAQRSVRQQEMSPDRESRTGTLASRTSPPPLPESLLQSQRTLEEDMLRGANDHYPSQYRKLVEDYFRALSREDRTP
jgi:DNA repair exonuclease SbcCD ATPase subunit